MSAMAPVLIVVPFPVSPMFAANLFLHFVQSISTSLREAPRLQEDAIRESMEDSEPFHEPF